MRWQILLVLFIVAFAFYEGANANDRLQVLEMMQKEKAAGVEPYADHCVIRYNDDGTETKTCQKMEDVPSPTGLIFNCKGIGKRLVCNNK